MSKQCKDFKKLIVKDQNKRLKYRSGEKKLENYKTLMSKMTFLDKCRSSLTCRFRSQHVTVVALQNKVKQR